MDGWSTLPEEILAMVLLLLPPQDRKTFLLVCRSWKEEGERSKFWDWVCLEVTGENLAVMPQVLAIERLKYMKKKIKVRAVSEDLLLEIERHPRLKVLDASGSDLSTIEPSLLARVVVKLEEVDLSGTKLTNQQYEAIFMFAARDCNLKKLNMSVNDISSVDPATLAKVVAHLDEVHFGVTDLTNQQCQAIFRFAANDCKLKKLNMSNNDLSSVDSDTLARVVAQLEEVDLSFTELTNEQCQALFRFLASDCNLKSLNMSSNVLSSVDPENLATVVAKLEEVHLGYTAPALNIQYTYP